MLNIPNLRRLPGKHLVGPDGERIGKVVDVYESTVAGGGTFATVGTGLFGTSASFFPLDTAEVDGDEVRVPYSKEFIKQAPHVADDDELTAEEEDRLFAYYGLGEDAGQDSTRTRALPTGAGDAGPDDVEVTLSEERLRVGTERVVTGRARLRKYVVSETVTQTVPVRHEELRVVREPIPVGALPTLPVSGVALSEEEHEVVLFAERPVVRKDVVPVERVRLDTVTVEGQETVTEELRKEHVELQEDAARADLEAQQSGSVTGR